MVARPGDKGSDPDRAYDLDCLARVARRYEGEGVGKLVQVKQAPSVYAYLFRKNGTLRS